MYIGITVYSIVIEDAELSLTSYSVIYITSFYVELGMLYSLFYDAMN